MNKSTSVIIKTEDAGQPNLDLTQKAICVYSEDSQQEASVDNADQLNKTVSGSSKGTQKIAPYRKKKLLKHFQVRGCGSDSFEEAVKWLNSDTVQMRDYFNRHAELAQQFVGEECNSLCFENVNRWLMTLEGAGLNQFCDYEQALIVKAIAENEALPSPNDLDGIDLRAVYKFLGNALMGLPQTKLEEKSAKFLADEFEALIDDVNSDAAEIETKDIKHTLTKDAEPVDISKSRAKMSLDPLAINAGLEESL